MVAGVILAAGRSSRMGSPKWRLLVASVRITFVAHLVETARKAGLDPIFVIGRKGESALADEVTRSGGTFVTNADPDRGQLSSIHAGLAAAEAAGASGIMVMPVDVPLVTPSVLRDVLSAIDEDGVQIARASHRGRHGHPVLFTRAVFDELRTADPAVGARAVVRADPQRVREVEVGEPGVAIDIDTPEDYRRVFGREL